MTVTCYGNCPYAVASAVHVGDRLLAFLDGIRVDTVFILQLIPIHRPLLTSSPSHNEASILVGDVVGILEFVMDLRSRSNFLYLYVIR